MSLFLLLILFSADQQPSPLPRVSFNHQIRPLLSDRCYTCHGPDERTRKGGLRLDDRESAIKSGALVPGKPDESELIVRLHATDNSQMPPAKANLPLTEEEKRILKVWIAQGAPYEGHWSFQKVRKIDPPETKMGRFTLTPIDRFIGDRLTREKITPTQRAAQELWLRRASLDLTGLPPTAEELNTFLANSSDHAARDVAITRMLASSRFGERMALDWLDLARYADSYGYQSDADTDFWPWRDWVVRALNENLPQDQFLTWQLAGDLIPNPTTDQKLATTFNRLHRMTGEGGSIQEEWRLEYVADRVSTFGTAMLGLTLECSRCHDHKYDPISTKEFYSLSAFFNNIDEWGTYDSPGYKPTPTMDLPTAAQNTRHKELSKALQVARESLRQASFSHGKGPVPDKAFELFLNGLPPKPGPIASEVGRYSFEEGESNNITNQVDPKKPANRAAANRIVPGRKGSALQFTGDDAANFPSDLVLHAYQPFTVSMEIQFPRETTKALIFHKSSGTDTGFHGPEARMEQGRAILALVRFWPGNAAAIETIDPIPRGEWIHLAFASDGSGTASGLSIAVNGKMVPTRIVRDGLTRNINPSGGGIVVGERMRTPGLKNCLMDELRLFGRKLSPLEIADLADGKSLAQAFAKKDEGALREYWLCQPNGPIAREEASVLAAQKQLFDFQSSLREIPVMEEMSLMGAKTKERQAFVLARGAYDAPRDVPAPRDIPQAVARWNPEWPKNRLGLAKWLTSPENPLAARVVVNRVWQHFFGKGLVTTPENFGLQGNLPTHPELLDFLTWDFVDHNWDLKRLCKQIVLSETYGLSSTVSPEDRAKDPDNQFYGRFSPRRLPAEVLRDEALWAGGLLVEKVGGPPARPYQPPGIWRMTNSFLPDYVEDKGDGLYRKSIYTFWRRTAPPPNMIALDAPGREACSARRQNTATPLQPLVLLNDPQWVEAARALGQSMLKNGETMETRLEWGHRRVTSRSLLPEEKKILVALWEKQQKSFEADPKTAEKLLAVGLTKADSKIKPADLAAATTIAATLLNLDAATTLR